MAVWIYLDKNSKLYLGERYSEIAERVAKDIDIEIHEKVICDDNSNTNKSLVVIMKNNAGIEIETQNGKVVSLTTTNNNFNKIEDIKIDSNSTVEIVNLVIIGLSKRLNIDSTRIKIRKIDMDKSYFNFYIINREKGNNKSIGIGVKTNKNKECIVDYIRYNE